MKTVIEHGVEITLTDKEYKQYQKERKKILEEARLKMQQIDYQKLVDDNNSLLIKVTKSIKEEPSPIKRKVLQTLLKDATSKEDLEYRTWLYNEGKLRSNWEVEDYNRIKKKEAYRNGTNFDTSSKVTNVACFLIPFTICIAVIMSKPDASALWFIYLPVAVLVACFFSFISMMLGYSLNISRGKRKGLPESDIRLQNERAKRNIGAVSGAVAGASVYRHTKKAVKDIANVDSWKELK